LYGQSLVSICTSLLVRGVHSLVTHVLPLQLVQKRTLLLEHEQLNNQSELEDRMDTHSMTQGIEPLWDQLYSTKEGKKSIQKTSQTCPLIMDPLFTGFRLSPQYWGEILGSFFKGNISLKKRTYCPLLRENATPFKRTFFLIRLK
jgi:hypothetical protein